MTELQNEFKLNFFLFLKKPKTRGKFVKSHKGIVSLFSKTFDHPHHGGSNKSSPVKSDKV